MKRLLTVLTGILVLSVSACAPQVDLEADEAAIREIEEQGIKAMAAKDVDGLLAS